MTLRSCFAPEECEIISTCLDIFVQASHIHELDAYLVSGFQREDYRKTISKIQQGEELDQEDARKIRNAVFHVSSFPLSNPEEAESRVGIDFRYVYWFAAYIEDVFESNLPTDNAVQEP
ncbi:hypothetical protein [Armatimonas rosea]|uniref:Uncharacterized protein n=1 Tax=Armatimonas rosea TaxID=685828 RepID=A0A7W9SMN1_ARMRO|nr:hypothetical protein [Armatimonas rosea]MBB6048643.1 hypothetical protein [Armatimonas rosea]